MQIYNYHLTKLDKNQQGQSGSGQGSKTNQGGQSEQQTRHSKPGALGD